MKMDRSIVVKALEGAKWLISDEYSSVIDEELKQNYEVVLELIENALREIKGKL